MADPPTTTNSIPRSRKMAETRLAILRCLSVGSVSAVMSARADWICSLVMSAGCIHELAGFHDGNSVNRVVVQRCGLVAVDVEVQSLCRLKKFNDAFATRAFLLAVHGEHFRRSIDHSLVL